MARRILVTRRPVLVMIANLRTMKPAVEKLHTTKISMAVEEAPSSNLPLKQLDQSE
jgi:hypothetical protein